MKYAYTVVARSGSGPVSVSSMPVAVEAASTPESVTITSFTPTGVDGQAKVTFDVGASHGSTNEVVCSPSCPGISTVSNSGQNGLTATIPYGAGANGSSSMIRIHTCNGSSGNSQTGASCSADKTASATTYGNIVQPTLNVSASGSSLDWSYSGNANGRPVNVVLTVDGTVIRAETSGNGGYSGSGSQNVGYSHTGNFTLTITDSTSTPNGARITKTATANARTVDPTGPTVQVSHGAACGGGGGTACPGPCTNPSCGYVHLTLDNFSGSVTCSLESNAPGNPFPNKTVPANPNYSGDPGWYMGYPGYWLQATCNGVTSPVVVW